MSQKMLQHSKKECRLGDNITEVNKVCVLNKLLLIDVDTVTRRCFSTLFYDV